MSDVKENRQMGRRFLRMLCVSMIFAAGFSGFIQAEESDKMMRPVPLSQAYSFSVHADSGAEQCPGDRQN